MSARRLLLPLGLLVCLAVSVWCTRFLFTAHLKNPSEVISSLVDLPERAIGLVSLEFDGVLSDYLMLKTMVFLGEKMERGERPSERDVDPQSELVALGGVHVAVGLIGGFPVSSSGSRTALAIASGARTQVYSLAAAAVVVVVLLVAGPILQWMPQAALGAVVLYAATKLVQVSQFRRLWGFRRREFALALVTLFGTIFYGILAGVGIAIALSLLEMGIRLARPHDAVLGRVPGLAGMHDVTDYPGAQTLPGLIIYRFEAPLFFANVGELRRRVQLVIDRETEAYPDAPPRWFLLNVEANTEVDITAADGLRELQGDLAAQGVLLGLVRLKRDLYEPLRRAGVVDLIGEDMCFPTLPVAEEAFVEWARTHPRVVG